MYLFKRIYVGKIVTCHCRSQTCHIVSYPSSTTRNAGLYRVTICYQRHKRKSSWKRPPGRRPQKTWLQQVITGQDSEVDVIYSPAQNHSAWRSLRPILAGQLQNSVTDWVDRTELKRHKHIARKPTMAIRKVRY